MTRIAFIGGGGFSKEALEIAKLNGHDVVGYVGDNAGVLDRPYWGELDELIGRREEFDAVCVAFGAVDRKSAVRRAYVLNWVTEQKFPSVALVSPYAVRAEGVSVGNGAIVAHGVVMSVDAAIGEFAILNSNAVVGHDAQIGRNSTIAPTAFIGGMARVGDNCLIGPGALVLESRAVGNEVVVGLGATVVRNVKDGATVMPVRSKVLK